MTQTGKRLYRSRSNRILFGVCSGLSEFFNLDVTLIRLAFVLGVVFGFGSLLLVYIVMIFVVPEEPLSVEPVVPQSQPDQPAPPSESQ